MTKGKLRSKPSDADLIRLLRSESVQKPDYEIARYLIDKDLARGNYSVSRSRHEWGQVKDLIWSGPTVAGLDWLSALENASTIEESNDQQSKENADPKATIGRQATPKDTIKKTILIGVVIIVLGYLITKLFLDPIIEMFS